MTIVVCSLVLVGVPVIRIAAEDRTAHTEYCYVVGPGIGFAAGDHDHSHEPGDFLTRPSGGCTYVPRDESGGYWSFGFGWSLTLMRDGDVQVLSSASGSSPCRPRGFFRPGDRVIVRAGAGSAVFVGRSPATAGFLGPLHAGPCRMVEAGDLAAPAHTCQVTGIGVGMAAVHWHGASRDVRAVTGPCSVEIDMPGGYVTSGSSWRITIHRGGETLLLTPADAAGCRRAGFLQAGDRVVAEAGPGSFVHVGRDPNMGSRTPICT